MSELLLQLDCQQNGIDWCNSQRLCEVVPARVDGRHFCKARVLIIRGLMPRQLSKDQHVLVLLGLAGPAETIQIVSTVSWQRQAV